jgi:hypothetical protein
MSLILSGVRGCVFGRKGIRLRFLNQSEGAFNVATQKNSETLMKVPRRFLFSS